MKLFFFILAIPWLAYGELPIDIVFDIDQTIATKVHEGPGGDYLADPNNPRKNIISITYEEVQMDANNYPLKDAQGKIIAETVTEEYRIYEGVADTMERMLEEERLGRARVSFFSGGTIARNEAVLEAIKLKNGQSLKSRLDQAKKRRIFGREDMTRTGVGPDGRIRERFKKDLRIVNPDISDVVLVDDIQNFVPNDQLGHVLWIDEDFPYPERKTGVVPSAGMITEERDKFKRLSVALFKNIEKRHLTTTPFSQLISKEAIELRATRPCGDIFQKIQRLFTSP